MENETYKVRSFLEGVARCGAAQAIKQIEPLSDRLTQRKAYSFLKAYDTQFGGEFEHGEAWIKRMVKEGKITAKRHGNSPNSPLCYSKAEIMQALVTEEAVKNRIFKGTTL